MDEVDITELIFDFYEISEKEKQEWDLHERASDAAYEKLKRVKQNKIISPIDLTREAEKIYHRYIRYINYKSR